MKRWLQIALGIVLLVSLAAVPGTNTAKAAGGGKLMIVSYELVKGDFSPGSEARIAFSIKNQDMKNSALDVVAEFGCSQDVTPIYGESNQKYLGTVGAGQTIVAEFDVNVGKNVEPGKAAISLGLSYTKAGEEAGNTASISMPVVENSGLNINGVSVAENAKVGSKALISITYENTSDKTIKNVQFHIEGNIDEATKTVDIGNLESGASDYKDVYVVFKELGEQTINLSVSYTDMSGQSFNKDVSSEVIDVSQDEVTAEKNSVVVNKDNGNSIIKMILKVLVLISIVVLLAATAMNIMRKKD